MDLHHLLLAGLPAHSALTGSGHQSSGEFLWLLRKAWDGVFAKDGIFRAVWYSGDLYQPSNCSMLSQTMMTTRDFGASPDSPVALPAAR
jgi:hypothetical protein